MKHTHGRAHSAGLLVFVLVASLLVQSCIDERYDINRGISTTMTVGGDSLAIPLGKTDTIRLGDFLDPKDMEMLKTMEDGGYALSVNDSISADIPKIDRSALSVADQTFSQQQTVDFGEINLENFFIPGISVNSNINFNISQITLGNFGLPSVDETLSFGAGMSGYTLSESNKKIDDIDKAGSTGTIFSGLNLPEYSGSESIPLPIANQDPVTVNYNQNIDFSVTVPAGVTGVSNVTLIEIPPAEFTVSILLMGANGVLSTGKILPNLTINPSDLFEFTDLPTGVITFETKDSMTVNNQFSISKTCHFNGLNIEGEPINKVLSKSSQVTTNGSVQMNDVYVLSNKINDVKDMYIRVSVSVNDMVIKSMDLNVAPVHSTISGSTDLDINNSIPADIEKINAVYFDEASHSLSISLQPNNLPSGINSQLTLDSLTIHFPNEFILKPTAGLSDNTFTIKNASFTNGFNKAFELESFDLSHLAVTNSALSWSGGVSYSGGVSISFPDKINSANIPSSGNDPKVNMNVQTDLAFESAEIITKNKDINLPDLDVPIKFNIDITDKVKRLDTIKMAADTKIRLRITKPNLPLKLAGNPLSITFPRLFSFEEFLLNNTYTISDTIPDLIEFTLKSLNVCKELVGGSLSLDTVIHVGGSVRLRAGTVDTKDVESLSNESLNILASTDDLRMSSTSLKLNALSTAYNDSTVLDLAAIDLPEEIVSLDSILLANGAKLELDIDVTNMPHLDKPLVADIELDFPSLLGFAPGEADHDNKIVIHQAFIDGKLHKTINLKGLFFDGQDLNGRLEINEMVKYSVGVSVGETTVNSEDLTSNPITVSVNVKLSGISFESVYGKLNPGIEPIEDNIPISGLPSFMLDDDITLDITKPVITFETNCNLGVPIFIDVDFKPSRNGVVLNDAVQSVRIRLPKALSPNSPKKTNFWIAPDSAGMPQNYVFVQADIQKLFKKIPDEIWYKINASADISEQHYIDLLADYSMDVKYDVTVPFAFGEDFNVQIKDTITGLDPMIGESALSGKSLELLGTFQNSIPLELELELIPLDEDNIPLDVVPVRQLIEAGASDGSATTSNLTIRLNDPNGELKNLRGFELSFKASSNSTVAGTPIRPENYIIAELKARLNGGITIGGKNN